jgi:hypothetical protein
MCKRMVENRSSIVGIIAMIIGASGLGIGTFAVINFQVIQGLAGPPGQDGTDGLDGLNGINGTDGLDGKDAPGGLVVGILDPDYGETVSGDVIIRALIYGSENYVLSVLRNGTEIGISLPMVWNTLTVSDGWWNITVVVTNVSTNNKSSDGVIVYVDNTPEPTLKARATIGPSYPIAQSSLEIVNLTVESFDPGNDLNLTSNTYIVPEDGYYLIIGQVAMSSLLGASLHAYVQVNGFNQIIGTGHGTTGSMVTATAADIIWLSTGQSVVLWVQHTATGSKNLLSTFTYISISQV